MEDILTYTRNAQEDYYTILGCDEQSTVEQINTEYKVRARACHPDKHPENPEAANTFAVLQRAKDTLCDATKRQNYDRWRRCGLAMSYETWCAKKDSIHMSMHWATKKQEPMLMDSPGGETKEASSTGEHTCNMRSEWKEDSASDTLRQFRNYEL